MTTLPTVASYVCPECGGNSECSDAQCRHIPTSNVGKMQPNYYCRGWNGKRGKYCGTRAGQGTQHPGFGRCSLHGGNHEMTHGKRVADAGRYGNLKVESIRDAYDRHLAHPDPLNQLSELAATRALFEDFINRYSEFTDALLAWHSSFGESSRPIAADRIQSLLTVLDEYEALLSEKAEDDDLKTARDKIEELRDFVQQLGQTPDEKKPRKVLDITIAHQLLNSINQQIDTISRREEATHISKRDFFRVMGEMARGVDLIVADDTMKQRIKDAWLDIRLPS